MINFPKGIEEYAAKHSDRESSLLYDLSEETRASTNSQTAGSLHTIGTLLRLLVEVSHAKNILEIGTYTGYTALSMAMGLDDDGKVITLDENETLTNIGKKFWDQTHFGKLIDLRIAPPLESLESMRETDFDIVFFNGDKKNKESYTEFWEAVIPKVRPSGLLIVDNVMWSERVLNPQDETDLAINAFNEYVRYDQRVQRVMLTIKDGITIARKR